MRFNEDSRVKIPTILHLIKLGYNYLSLKNQVWDENTNIFLDLFKLKISELNPNLSSKEIDTLYIELSLLLDNEDLGKAFFEKLVSRSGIRLIDFENFDNNSFHVVTELTYKKDDDEFRPDIICLINGMPLVFIEVKKPNNLQGIRAEHIRMQTRFQNKKFRKFINLTQFMIFSNNMEYDDESSEPLQGAFYSSTSYLKPVFNYFREEENFNLDTLLKPLKESEELKVLKDNNLLSIRNSEEYKINKLPTQPTNRICTSLLQRERLKFILEFAFAYVKESTGLQKHIMRYPQLFATNAIANKIESGVKKGIIWHTQGSGKTALTFYNIKHLTHYFRNKSIVPKFYFVVDRLDLLIQAGREFKARGLVVHNVNSRDEFARDIKSNMAIHNHSGKPEITVVNIQKFKDDPDVIKNQDYNLNSQRVFFLDEVHRSYNPKGSFLANLEQADSSAIKIGLTGTPLLGTEYNSKTLFGNYIHKYYYNSSIKDGYTLRLIREEIETSYRIQLQDILKGISTLKGNIKSEDAFAHPSFVEPMLEYIVKDFEKSRLTMDDNSIGAMVVCDSAKQAKMMYEIFQDKYANPTLSIANEGSLSYGDQKRLDRKVTKGQVILHDVGTKEDRKDWVEDYKAGKIDILFVYNMLLTGFDAKRLKKLYVGRVIKAHNLLQTLTRVNRTYKDFKYGFVVDFADIQKEFDKTNQDYFNELQSELGDDLEHYTALFKSEEDIHKEIQSIKEVLFQYNTENMEIFCKQLEQISDKRQIQQIVKALNQSKSLYNLIRLSGNFELLEKLDFTKLNVLAREAYNRLALINTKEALENKVDASNLLNEALEDVIFSFIKVKEEEMVIADELKNILRKTREGLGGNFDQKDPQFVSLKEELERLFNKKNLNEVTKEDMESNIESLNKIYAEAKELNRKNQLLKAKYDNDEKYARLHKRLSEKDPLTDSELKLFEALSGLKQSVDEELLKNTKLLENENYVEKLMRRLIVTEFKKNQHIDIDIDDTKRVQRLLLKEYMNEFYGGVA